MPDIKNEFSAQEEQSMRRQAQQAREDAANRVRKTRSMPDAFPVPQYGEQED